MKICHRVTTIQYRNSVGDITRIIALTLLTETCVNVEEYGGHSEGLVPLMAVVYKCEADAKYTGDNGYSQPQAVAERRDVAIPCYVGVVG
jgi:hypothetical protein